MRTRNYHVNTNATNNYIMSLCADRSKTARRVAYSADSDQTLRSDFGYTICYGLSVRILRVSALVQLADFDTNKISFLDVFTIIVIVYLIHFWVDCLQPSHSIQTAEFPQGSCP